GPCLAHGSAERSEGCRMDGDTEQVQEVGETVRGVQSYLLELEAHLLREHGRTIVLGDAAVITQQVQHGQIGCGTAIRQTATFDIWDLLRGKTLAHRREETRLAQAGRPAQTGDWPGAGRDLLQNRLEQGHFVLTPYKHTTRISYPPEPSGTSRVHAYDRIAPHPLCGSSAQTQPAWFQRH